ncbi:HAMP domain-containing sensor histidine kinase [Umezawaea tangerina]|uniref:histidine kinase n=1 Tax=Umezawaea tangerina TaxID=84725 RepID=A0A2T0SNE8_9PSEU|nr:HAMP domain-containing sensor histidine kinase [Umezawaea tangerina]PRY34903.1 signal transduction histidine kinase [Umezawaea tangerina]
MTGFGIRTRLLLGFVVALVVAGGLVVAVVYVGIRFVPTYELVPAHPIGDEIPSAGASPEGRATTMTTIALRSKQDVWSMVLATSAVGMLLVVVVGLVAGRLVVRRLLAPLGAISRVAAATATGDLEQRVNAGGPPDELRDLADTFDSMLDELQELFAAHRRFAANASHELLTPLATTRSILQVAMSGGSAEELAELAPMLLATNERNITIVTALLQLAGAEHERPDAELVDLGDLVRLVAADHTATAQERDVRLHVDRDQECTVTGSTPLLRQLVHNLLDNALTYNVPGGQVDLSVRHDRDSVVLEVRNTGPLVTPGTTDRLFEPFYRAERSRIRSGSSGHGLGLAIVRSIVHAHQGGATAVGNAGGGLTVRVELPRSVHDGLTARTAGRR